MLYIVLYYIILYHVILYFVILYYINHANHLNAKSMILFVALFRPK